MKPEIYFLRYAFPCTESKLHRNEITKEEFEKLKYAVIKGEALDRKFLERIYNTAFNEIKKLAQRLKKPAWSLEAITEYFLNEHNRFIQAKKGPYANVPRSIRDYCKTYVAEVIRETKDKNHIVVSYDKNKERIVLRTYIPDAKVGDKVRIHQSYIIEKI